ncbi:MAG: hypothetical protein OEV91_06525, partial [Desulfobulbaceae bacterium]|nr:hypothetical protein [Desulfobulbaceae bacterium]
VMSEYVSRCTLTANGQAIEDFKTVSEKEIELHKPVNLMNKTGVCKITPRYGVSVDYVVPEDVPEFDWEAMSNGTLAIEFGHGKRTTYTGVYIAKVGDQKIDGDNETVRAIELIATGRVKE